MVCWSAFSLVWRGWMLILGKRPKNWLSFLVRSRLRDWLHLSGPIQTPPTIATRLIALLPNSNDTKNQSRNTLHSISATINSRPWWVYVIFMSFVLGTQFMAASKQLPMKAASVPAEPSSMVSPQIPPDEFGQY